MGVECDPIINIHDSLTLTILWIFPTLIFESLIPCASFSLKTRVLEAILCQDLQLFSLATFITQPPASNPHLKDLKLLSLGIDSQQQNQTAICERAGSFCRIFCWRLIQCFLYLLFSWHLTSLRKAANLPKLSWSVPPFYSEQEELTLFFAGISSILASPTLPLFDSRSFTMPFPNWSVYQYSGQVWSASPHRLQMEARVNAGCSTPPPKKNPLFWHLENVTIFLDFSPPKFIFYQVRQTCWTKGGIKNVFICYTKMF